MREVDVAIIGTGPAGLSAAIFCGRADLKTIVIGDSEHSQAWFAVSVENYLGFPDGIKGPELLRSGIKQAEKSGVHFLKDDVLTAAALGDEEHKTFIIKTNKGENISCHAMIIATGMPIRFVGIKNEEKLIGKGLHYCVPCDAPLYKNKKIAVIGNTDHAAEDAIEALSYTTDVTIIGNADTFEFSDAYRQEIEKRKIGLLPKKVTEFKTEKWIESIVLESGEEIKFDGVFMACGEAGALDFAANLGLAIKDDVIVVDENNMTSMNGVFAAGNCVGRCRQIAKNVGDGCNAAVSAVKYLSEKKIYSDYGKKMVSEALRTEPVKENMIKIQKRKIRIGWFSFSCCEDSTIIFTELLNDYYDKWKDIVEFAHARVLKKNNELRDIDIAFVEGAISNDKAAEELREIRKNSKKVIAIGSCAVTGMPSAQRNEFDEGRKREIDPIVRAFDYSKTVVPIRSIVTVDDSVPGCPMTETGFLTVLNKHLKEFGVDA